MTRSQRGFTLLEVLIALAIVGALLVIAFGGMRVALAAWRQGEDRAEAHQHVRGVALLLARTIEGAYPYSGAPGEAPESVLLFRGTADRLELVTQSPPFSFPVPVAFTAVVIALSEDRDRPGLVIAQRALPNRNPFTDATPLFQDPAIASVELKYLDDSGSWQDAWDARNENHLPRAVRISLGTLVNGTPRQLPPLTISLRVGAGTGQ